MNAEQQPVADRAELYVRSLLPEGYSEQQGETLDTLGDLVEAGVIGTRQVQVCGNQVPVSAGSARTAIGEQLVARLAAFQEWAEDNDCSLAPALEIRDVDDSLTDVSYRAFRLPALLLAEYRDGDLHCVTPHHDGDGLRRVGDRLDQLATGDPTTFEPLAQTAPLAPTVTVDTEPGTDGTDAEDSAPLQQR